MNKVKKALELAPLKDLESHQKYCKLVGSMLPEECRRLTAALAATPTADPPTCPDIDDDEAVDQLLAQVRRFGKPA